MRVGRWLLVVFASWCVLSTWFFERARAQNSCGARIAASDGPSATAQKILQLSAKYPSIQIIVDTSGDTQVYKANLDRIEKQVGKAATFHRFNMNKEGGLRALSLRFRRVALKSLVIVVTTGVGPGWSVVNGGAARAWLERAGEKHIVVLAPTVAEYLFERTDLFDNWNGGPLRSRSSTGSLTSNADVVLKAPKARDDDDVRHLSTFPLFFNFVDAGASYPSDLDAQLVTYLGGDGSPATTAIGFVNARLKANDKINPPQNLTEGPRERIELFRLTSSSLAIRLAGQMMLSHPAGFTVEQMKKELARMTNQSANLRVVSEVFNSGLLTALGVVEGEPVFAFDPKLKHEWRDHLPISTAFYRGSVVFEAPTEVVAALQVKAQIRAIFKTLVETNRMRLDLTGKFPALETDVRRYLYGEGRPEAEFFGEPYREIDDFVDKFTAANENISSALIHEFDRVRGVGRPLLHWDYSMGARIKYVVQLRVSETGKVLILANYVGDDASIANAKNVEALKAIFGWPVSQIVPPMPVTTVHVNRLPGPGARLRIRDVMTKIANSYRFLDLAFMQRLSYSNQSMIIDYLNGAFGGESSYKLTEEYATSAVGRMGLQWTQAETRLRMSRHMPISDESWAAAVASLRQQIDRGVNLEPTPVAIEVPATEDDSIKLTLYIKYKPYAGADPFGDPTQYLVDSLEIRAEPNLRPRFLTGYGPTAADLQEALERVLKKLGFR